MSWVPLHQHSQYSILDATAPVKAIAEKAAEFGMPAVALTDHGNMYGAIDFYQACQKVGVKPIIGCEVYVAPASRHEKKKMPGQKVANHLVLLAKNEVGYKNLCKLTSIGFTEGFYYFPRIDKEALEQYSEGLVCLSACMGGKVAQLVLEGSQEELLAEVEWYRGLFGDDYYLELQRHRMESVDELMEESWLVQNYESFVEKQEKINRAVRGLGIKVVATNDSHYMERDDWCAHEILLNVQSGEPIELWDKEVRIPNPKRRIYPSHEYYFKSPEEMAELFSDCPEAIANTLEVADKCNLELDFSKRHYPTFDCEEGYLQKLCDERIIRRYTPARLEKVAEQYPGRDPLEVVHDRLVMEMEVILSKGMADYLLIVWDFIDWAKRHGIPVGPGRGSGAGSIICYLTGITDIEPLGYNLLFERFINPERSSYPDIDVDICMDRRGEVIDYVVEKYGSENVAQIITFGTMKAKMAIKDVGRVLNVPLSKVNAIAKLVPEEIGITLDKALDTDADLHRMYTEDQETGRLIDLAKRLEGAVRNTGVHAAGVIVSGDSLTDHIPICTAKDSEMALTQYAMKPVEKVGMLKMDFLGLTTLTSIELAVRAVEKRTGERIDPLDLPMDDPKTFALLNEGRTMGVFQLESSGMRDLAKNLQIERFEEIIAVVALYRPGPMAMIPSFVARKLGTEKIEYDHPLMEEILKETYGIMVYQEQVMQIAQKLAGYSLAEGDVLRRAMGKKIHEEMASQRGKFTDGAVANGIDEETAISIFDKIAEFASYGFNKSHAACYGFIAYVTAYFKANHPAEWMAALMTCVGHDTAKVAKFIREAKSMGIEVLPPDVNEAGSTFVATPQGIRFAISGIKGVGHGVVETIVQERDKNGAFESLFDFCKRVDAGKKTTEQLVWAGCFDFTGWSRDALVQSVEPVYEVASSDRRDQASGVISLFSLMEGGSKKQFEEPPKVTNPSNKNTLLLREKELLGFFVTGHPMDAYKKVLARLSAVTISRAQQNQVTTFRTAFIIETIKVRIASKSQRKFAILMVSNGDDSHELPLWPDLYEEYGHLLVENQMLYAVLRLEPDRIGCRWLGDLTQVNEAMIAECDRAFDKEKQMVRRPPPKKKPKEKPVENQPLHIKLDAHAARFSQILKIKELFLASPGTAPITLEFCSNDQPIGRVIITTGISPSDALKKRLHNLPAVMEVT